MGMRPQNAVQRTIELRLPHSVARRTNIKLAGYLPIWNTPRHSMWAECDRVASNYIRVAEPEV
jgi:hypothetical protein